VSAVIAKLAISMAAINSGLSMLPRRRTCEAAMRVRLPFNRIDVVIGFIVLAGAERRSFSRARL
jgi:hypothetical protein